MNVALTDIMQDLNVSISTVQWLSTGYMLALGIVMATGISRAWNNKKREESQKMTNRKADY
jgi:hypothetical protein